jgi:S1-C subfamily serine protease
MKNLVMLALLSLSCCGNDYPPVAPSVDLSAVRFIVCSDTAEGDYVGSGFLYKDHVLITADHIARGIKSGRCVDSETQAPLKIVSEDEGHDFAMLSSPSLPTDIPYLRVSCQPFKKGEVYMSYGITPYGEVRPILRNNVLKFTGKKWSGLVDWGDKISFQKNMGNFSGSVAPGMSGGPVTTLDGSVVSLNSAGIIGSTQLYAFAEGPLCSGANASAENGK